MECFLKFWLKLIQCHIFLYFSLSLNACKYAYTVVKSRRDWNQPSLNSCVSFASNSFPSPPLSVSRWSRISLMSWSSAAACGSRLACSWWGPRHASKRRSRPSIGLSCCCMVILTSSVTLEAPRWCTRTPQVRTRRSRWGWFGNDSTDLKSHYLETRDCLVNQSQRQWELNYMKQFHSVLLVHAAR